MPRSRLDDHSLAPVFYFTGKEGLVFDLLEFRRRENVVLFFVSGLERKFLLEAEEAYASLKERNTQMAVVCFLPFEKVEEFYRRNRLSFDILPDEHREVVSKFLFSEENEDIAALFVIDKSGKIFFHFVEKDVTELPSFSDIIRSLQLIESQ